MKFQLSIKTCSLAIVGSLAINFSQGELASAGGCASQNKVHFNGLDWGDCGGVSVGTNQINVEEFKSRQEQQLAAAIADYNSNWSTYYAQWLEEQRVVAAQKQQQKQVALADNTILCLKSDGAARYLCQL
ncbi:hypothetical protein HC931_11495 [Candidatus Gracilibacteria bacterium]|nr:hypothetical protein [Candidatus Gracilibacteria bacterium]NJM87727.1 hypothetical protein [Hydrococcus sp. RU_2_2]NJP19434.1 hypothetical protein [Hydrococcus sp. CRU_1_1]